MIRILTSYGGPEEGSKHSIPNKLTDPPAWFEKLISGMDKWDAFWLFYHSESEKVFTWIKIPFQSQFKLADSFHSHKNEIESSLKVE